MNRRQALGAFGAVSLTGLLAACGSGDETGGSIMTTDGTTAPVETKTTTTAATKLSAEQFDSAATWRVATELTEGPYHFGVEAIRSDIREDREGTLLRLGVRVREAAGCEPIENAIVDVWHCDALGIYSGFESSSNGGGGGAHGRDTFNESDGILRRVGRADAVAGRRGDVIGLITLDVERR